MMRERESITLDLDRSAVEIATGYGGVGVFMTILGSVWHGKRARHITVALPRGKADELARILRMAADASRFNEATREREVERLDHPGNRADGVRDDHSVSSRRTKRIEIVK